MSKSWLRCSSYKLDPRLLTGRLDGNEDNMGRVDITSTDECYRTLANVIRFLHLIIDK